MTNSVLDSTKKVLGIAADYEAFDLDIITHINSALAVLTQLGVGPADGMEISDASTTWGDLVGNDPVYNSVRTYVYLRVRLLFDPPQTSFLIKAQEEQLRELEWRISTHRESVLAGVSEFPDTYIIDGGTP